MLICLKMFIAAVLLSLILTPLVRRLAIKVGAVDVPDKRKVHKELIPRLGGLGIYLSFAAVMYFFFPAEKDVHVLLMGCTVIVLVGIIDDLYSLPAKVKLLGQIAAACVPIIYGIEIDVMTDPWGGMVFLPVYISYPLTIAWIVGAVNTLNLIDGLDGLAAGVTCIAAVTLTVVALKTGLLLPAALMAALAGSTLGFLKYNFNPATIFMGDTGSMLLGYLIATISMIGAVKSMAAIAFIVPIFTIGVPVLDTAFAIIRRFRAGQPIFKPDKGHLHHRLLAMGFSHRKTVLVMYAISAVLSIIAVLLMQLPSYIALMMAVLLLFLAVLLARRIGVLRV